MIAGHRHRSPDPPGVRGYLDAIVFDHRPITDESETLRCLCGWTEWEMADDSNSIPFNPYTQHIIDIVVGRPKETYS